MHNSATNTNCKNLPAKSNFSGSFMHIFAPLSLTILGRARSASRGVSKPRRSGKGKKKRIRWTRRAARTIPPSALTFVWRINPGPGTWDECCYPDERGKYSPQIRSHVCRVKACVLPVGSARWLKPLHPGGKSVCEWTQVWKRVGCSSGCWGGLSHSDASLNGNSNDMSQMTLQCCGPYERQRLISTACLSEKGKKRKKSEKQRHWHGFKKNSGCNLVDVSEGSGD